MRLLRLMLALFMLAGTACSATKIKIVYGPPYGGSQKVYCNSQVIKQFERAWEADNDGRLREGTWEYGFRIDWVQGGYLIGPLIMGDAERHITIPTTVDTIAIAHVHPINGVSHPSQLDMDGIYPDYVISQDGLWLTNPRTHTYQFLKKFDQQFKECPVKSDAGKEPHKTASRQPATVPSQGTSRSVVARPAQKAVRTAPR